MELSVLRHQQLKTINIVIPSFKGNDDVIVFDKKYSMKVKLFFFGVLTAAMLSVHTAGAQTPKPIDYGQDFEWMKRIIEQNDAGYSYTLQKKGQAAYDLTTQLTREKLKTVQTPQQCVAVINEWLGFFRNGHIGVNYIGAVHTANKPAQASVATPPQMWQGDIKAFEKAAADFSGTDFQGIWEMSGAYKMGIAKEGDGYVGFIL